MMSIAKRLTFLAAAIASLVVAPALSVAGGLARPNPVSARSVGMGGAFSAIADDPTALHFNPAGLARLPTSNLLLGGEFVIAPRSYEPIFEDGRCDQADPPATCQEQSPSAPVRPLPSLGFATRLTREGIPSRLTFGVGVWNTFGGQLAYSDERPIAKTLIETRNAVIEVVPGVAYEVNDVLAVGFAFRLGIGLFDSKAVQRPSDAELSAIGLGAGATIGVLLTPTEKLSVGAYYRTPLNVTTKGDATIYQMPPLKPDLEYVQRWPDEAGISVAFKPNDSLVVAGQFDWHGWGRVNTITPVYVAQPDLTKVASIYTDWNDSMSLHLGAQYGVNDKLDLRGGFTYDTRAVIIRTQERQFLDSNKMLFALGGSYQVHDKWRVDTAFELGPGGTTTIEDNEAEAAAAGWREYANVSPGDHSGKLYTFELAVQYLF